MARHREVLERRCVTYQQQEAAHGAANEERGTPSQHATQRQIGLSASRVVVPPALNTRRADAGSSLRAREKIALPRARTCSRWSKLVPANMAYVPVGPSQVSPK